MKIHGISAREILDSRGNPTIATTVELDDGTVVEASVPSGASTGANEAVELRDNDKDRFFGMGELAAVSNVNSIIGVALIGQNPENQAEIDEKLKELDGTKNKGNLGANSILSVSMAVARAAAVSNGVELFEHLGVLFGNQNFSLPTPMFNILNGGKHASNNVDIQETMVVPTGLKSFENKLRAGSEIYHALGNILKTKGLATTIGDEGGFAPDLARNEEVFEFVLLAIEQGGYAGRIRISVDMAANSYANGQKYALKAERTDLASEEYRKILVDWAKKYNLYSLEDGLSEEDGNWKALTAEVSPTITIGDDLFVTDAEKIELGGKEKLAGGVIIKPNQIGTVSETFAAIKKAKENKMKVVVSHRSGETEDSFIADLAVAVGADFIKSGAPARSERLAKYNRLSKIEDILANNN